MNSSVDSDQLWVLKRDVVGKMNLHSGKGVSFVYRWEELVSTVAHWTSPARRAAGKLPWNQGLVQPYVPPFIGKLPYNRKAEIRIFLAVVDTAPLEVYAYADVTVVMATQTFDAENQAKASKCMHDTHNNHGAECQRVRGGGNLAAQVNKGRSQNRSGSDAGPVLALNIDLATYADGVGWSAAETEQMIQRALTLLGKVVYHRDAAQVLKQHAINRKIREAKARCFSVIRADFGFSASLTPVLFEINDWPWLDDNDRSAQIKTQWRAHRELFQMLGLDVPAVRDQRRAIDRRFMGRWRPLKNPLHE